MKKFKFYLGSSTVKKLAQQSSNKAKYLGTAATSDNASEKSFKRIISNKKLPARFSLKEKKHETSSNSSSSHNTTKESYKFDDYVNVNYQPERTSQSQKREVTLYRDDNLGFGFIAGSEKPLKIRFVTPGLK